jgi:hypothetical protein
LTQINKTKKENKKKLIKLKLIKRIGLSFDGLHIRRILLYISSYFGRFPNILRRLSRESCYEI